MMMQKRFGSLVWGLLGTLAMICAVLLSGSPAHADTYGVTGGDGSTITTFYVQSWGSATITLTQESGVFTSTTGGSARAWGRYHVDCSLNGASQRLEWKDPYKDTFVIRMNQAGLYKISLTPYTNPEMSAEVSVFGSWKVLPTWSLTNTQNCQISTAPTPEPVTGNYLTVYYRDQYGKQIGMRTVYCSVGSNTITAPQTLQNGRFYLSSASTQVVTLTAGGVLSPATVTFYYAEAAATPAPTQQPISTASCTVYYRDVYGSLLSTTSYTCRTGSNTITAPATLSVNGRSYSRISSASQSVTLYASGSLSATSVTFFYQITSTPTPAPATATVYIYYRDSAGNLLQSSSETMTVGTRTFTAPSTLSVNGRTYKLYTAQSQQVTLYASGSLSTSSLTFYYQVQNTPTPAPVTATVYIYYRDSSGNMLQSSSETMTVGTRTFTAPSTLSAGGRTYKLYTAQSQQVTLYASGSLSTSSLTFYYQVQNTPTPAPVTATVYIYYRDSSGNMLQSSSETMTVGTRTFTAPATLSVGGRTYKLYTAQSQQVTLYANGTLSASSLSFYYQLQNTPTPVPATATIYIYYRDNAGNLLQTDSKTITVGTHTFTAPSTLWVSSRNYQLIPPTSQQVTLYQNGAVSASSVTFYYQRESTPAPVTVSVRIYYRDSYGSILQQQSETMTVGTRTFTAPATLSAGGKTYNLTSTGSQSVTLYSDGTLSASSVDFYYQEYNPVTATITVQKIDVDTMATLDTRSETLGVGTHTIKAGNTPSGYDLYDASTASVTVYENGNVSQSVVTFRYRRKATTPPVTPVPVTPEEGQVIPTSWDTQFKDGSLSPRSINTLPRICDGNLGRSFYYTMWASEQKDDIPEITITFGPGSDIASVWIAVGELNTSTYFYNKARPSKMEFVVYSDEGVNRTTFEIPRNYDKRMVPYSFNTLYHNVTKIEVFITNIWVGTQDRYEVHIAEMAFYDR